MQKPEVWMRKKETGWPSRWSKGRGGGGKTRGEWRVRLSLRVIIRTLAFPLREMGRVLQDKVLRKNQLVFCLLIIAALVTHQVLLKMGDLSEGTHQQCKKQGVEIGMGPLCLSVPGKRTGGRL